MQTSKEDVVRVAVWSLDQIDILGTLRQNQKSRIERRPPAVRLAFDQIFTICVHILKSHIVILRKSYVFMFLILELLFLDALTSLAFALVFDQIIMRIS